MATCAFVFVNGLHPDIFLELADLMGLPSDRSAYNQMKYLLRKFEENPKGYNLYAYNVSQNEYQYLTGVHRQYVHADLR